MGETAENSGGIRAKVSWPLLLGLASAAFLIQMIPNLFGGYGYFIDEFYYLACAKRLALGYVDHPPLAPFLLRINTSLLGDSIPSIRLLPAFAGAVAVVVAGWLSSRLGGRGFAQGLAALATLVSPLLLAFFGIFSVNAFEILIWLGCVSVVILMIQHDEPRLWLAFGALAGLGLENKHTITLLALGVVVSLALTPARKYLVSRWLWLGGLVAFVLFLPNLVWQIQNEWLSLEFYRNQAAYKNIPTAPWTILANQILFMNPVSFPLWVTGLWFFLFSRRGRSLRAIGLLYMILLASMSVIGSVGLMS